MSAPRYVGPPSGYFVLVAEGDGFRCDAQLDVLSDAFAWAENHAALETGKLVVVTHAIGAFRVVLEGDKA
jgi:hypothetical protein